MGNCNYKVKITDIQNKYAFRIFCAGDTSQIQSEIGNLENLNTTAKNNLVSAINEVDANCDANTSALNNKEDKTNKVTTIDNTSTNTQYPSAKCVYDSQEVQDANIEQNTTDIGTNTNKIDELKSYYESIYNALPKVSGTGESLTLNETAESVMKNKLYPQTSQEGTPTPDSPQLIHTISGNNTIRVFGKNLLDCGNQTFTQATDYISIPPIQAGIYNLICDATSNDTDSTKCVLLLYDTSKNVVLSTQLERTHNDKSITVSAEATYIRFYASDTWGHGAGDTATVSNIMISTNGGEYEPYQSQSKPLNLGDLEYNAIGDYKDEFVKVDGEWFLRKNIKKLVLDGTETWNGSSGKLYCSSITDYAISGNTPISNYFVGMSNVPNDASMTNNTIAFRSNHDYERFYLYCTQFSSKTDLTTWLGTHNMILYYATLTPQTITLPTTLQNQIESIYNATMSYKGQTNISQVNNDLAFVVESSALKDMSNE